MRQRTDHLHGRTAQVAKLKHVNRQESEDLAKAFMSPPFINQMIEFTAAKNKTQANMVFKFLRLSRPVRPLSSISSSCSSFSSVRHTEIGGCRCGLEWPGFHDQASMSGCTCVADCPGPSFGRPLVGLCGVGKVDVLAWNTPRCD